MSQSLVFPALGTRISITAAGLGRPGVQSKLSSVFTELDDRFSLQRPDSEAARVAAGSVPLRRASREFRDLYSLALHWRTATGAAFTPHRSDGAVDLSGVALSLAVQEAAGVLDGADIDRWRIDAGDIVLTQGSQEDGRPWTIRVVDPRDPSRSVSQYAAQDACTAVATCAVGQRVERSRMMGMVPPFRQVTVVAGDTLLAHVLASAIQTGGPPTLAQVQARYTIDVLACGADGRIWASAAFRAPAA